MDPPKQVRAPEHLWRFGAVGWAALGVGGAGLAARAFGIDPFFHALQILSNAYGMAAAMTIVTSAYAWLGVMWDWLAVGAPSIEPNLWVAAGYGVALAIAGVPRRTLWLLLMIAIGGFFPASLFFWTDLVIWIRDVSGSRVAPALEAWIQLGMLLQVVLMTFATRDKRLFAKLVGLVAVGWLVRAWFDDLIARQPAERWAAPVAIWAWYAVLYTVLILWSVRERRRQAAVRDQSRCASCDYDLSATTGNVCPECGGSRESAPTVASASESPTPDA